MSFTNRPSSSVSPSNTVVNVETQSTISPSHDPSFYREDSISHWNWDESLPFSDTLLSTFSALPSSNGNDQRGDLDVEVESSYGGLYYHTEEFLETLTSRDPSRFDDPSRTCSPIPLTCTSDGINFDPQRVKFDPQNNHPGPIHIRPLPRGVDTSSAKNASMSVFRETVTRTPQQFLNMYHTLNTLVNMEDELAATAQPANPLEAQEPWSHLPADMANELPSLPELSTISKPQGPPGPCMTYQDFKDACNNLLTLNAEYGAQIPQNAVDALPPSAFLKQSSEHNTTNYFAATQTPLGSGQGDHDFHFLSPDTNDYMGELQSVVQGAPCNDVDWDGDHCMNMQQLSAEQDHAFNPSGDYFTNYSSNNPPTSLPNHMVVDIPTWGGNLDNAHPLLQSTNYASSSSHGTSSQPPLRNPANQFRIVGPEFNMFQPTPNQFVLSTVGQLPENISFPQLPTTHPSHPALHQPLQPLVPDTLSTPQTPQKRKREEKGGNRVPAATPRPLKRQMVADAASTRPDISRALPSVDSLPPDDHRRKEPYTRGSNKKYTCQYPVGLNETCGVVILLKRGQRNWKRHLRTHAKKEMDMLERGVIDTNSEKIYALLWADKITVRCPDSDCTFSTNVWRTDGVLDEHLAKFHPDRYREKMERQSQRGSGKGKGKKNG
ncbi:hypothetical protein Clacol_004424 [Clathrus columnatus]|uniref:C2H2-type domain-containing protein n=1 Tax=Clathrus columnatus TaxID=1419009 RepID=A0AAV5AC29_9AGAM|nr:hypothetical protein Clacol_004424 [Clathrus columnatus]